MHVTFAAGNENAEMRGPASVSATVSALKRTYTAKTVAEAARRHGWKIKNQTAENNTITLKIGRYLRRRVLMGGASRWLAGSMVIQRRPFAGRGHQLQTPILQGHGCWRHSGGVPQP